MGLAANILLAALAASPAPGRELFGLVVGNNSSDDPEVARLRYADDDAVQNALLLSQLGARVVLLTELDADSRALYPDLNPSPPTRAALFAAMRELNRLMEGSRGQGSEPVLYFFYSGHGEVEHNEGHVVLEDGRLRRSEFLELIEQSRAAVNHVVIDACKSYFLVYDRGAGGERRRLSAALVPQPGALPANTGVLLSTSAAADSHEWEAYQGGIFSHELRSALRGAADADLDGSISYQEAAAFIWTANAAVPNRRFRPDVFSRPPGDEDPARAVLVEMRRAAGDRVIIGPGESRHIYLEDEKGLRLADVHPGAGQQVILLVPPRRPLFARRPGADEEVELPAGEQVRLAGLLARRAPVRTRGAEHVAFRRLFARTFDHRAVEAFRDRPVEVETSPPSGTDYTWVRRGLGIAAITFGVLGGTMSTLAYYERERADDRTDGLERSGINARIDRYNAAAVSLYALAGAGLVSYLVWTLWPQDELELQLMPSAEPQVRLTVRFW